MPHYIIHYKNDWVKLMVTSTVITHTLSVLYGAMLASNPAVPVFFSLAGRKSKKKLGRLGSRLVLCSADMATKVKFPEMCCKEICQEI